MVCLENTEHNRIFIERLDQRVQAAVPLCQSMSMVEVE